TRGTRPWPPPTLSTGSPKRAAHLWLDHPRARGGYDADGAEAAGRACRGSGLLSHLSAKRLRLPRSVIRSDLTARLQAQSQSGGTLRVDPAGCGLGASSPVCRTQACGRAVTFLQELVLRATK